MEQQELSHTANERAKSTTTMEDSLAVLIETKHALPIRFSTQFGFYPKELKLMLKEKSTQRCLQQVYS